MSNLSFRMAKRLAASPAPRSRTAATMPPADGSTPSVDPNCDCPPGAAPKAPAAGGSAPPSAPKAPPAAPKTPPVGGAAPPKPPAPKADPAPKAPPAGGNGAGGATPAKTPPAPKPPAGDAGKPPAPKDPAAGGNAAVKGPMGPVVTQLEALQPDDLKQVTDLITQLANVKQPPEATARVRAHLVQVNAFLRKASAKTGS